MARDRQRNPVVIALLELALEAAQRGEIDEVFVLARDPDGEWCEDYATDVLDDLQRELRTSVIRLAAAISAELAPPN